MGRYRESQSNLEKGPRRFFLICFSAAFLALSIRTLVFALYAIPTSSMVPTLIIGDYMYVSRWSYGWSNIGTFGGLLDFPGRVGPVTAPHRGDLIVFKSPRDMSTTLIKRLIGLPGDHIQMAHGELYINDVLVKREKLDQPVSFPGDDEPTEDIYDSIEILPDGVPHVIRHIRGHEEDADINNTAAITVPPHQYFFMGDNRDNSTDSRLPAVGMVPEENLVGKADFLFFSLEKNAKLWEIKKWPWAIRHQRLLKQID